MPRSEGVNKIPLMSLNRFEAFSMGYSRSPSHYLSLKLKLLTYHKLHHQRQ